MIGTCRSGCPVDFLLKKLDMNEKKNTAGISRQVTATLVLANKELKLSRCR